MKQTSKITKGVVLFTILVLPSLLYLYLTSGKHNFVFLPIVASQSQNYLPLIEEDRQGNPSHHFIQDFPLTETLDFRDLDSKIKLVFFSNAKDTLTSSEEVDAKRNNLAKRSRLPKSSPKPSLSTAPNSL